MNRTICMALLCLLITHCCMAQQYKLALVDAKDSATTARQITLLANEIIHTQKADNSRSYFENLFKLQILTGKYRQALATINILGTMPQPKGYLKPDYLQHQLFAKAKIEESPLSISFQKTFSTLLGNVFKKLDDKTSYRDYGLFTSYVDGLKADFENILAAAGKKTVLNKAEAIELCTGYYNLRLYQQIDAISRPLIKKDCDRRYVVKNQLVAVHNGVQINVVLVLKRGAVGPLPAALQYTIYDDSTFDVRTFAAAAYGYSGVIGYTRGKGLSPDKIVPYEQDGADCNDVITWVSTQPWCNGKVGMFGGSYNGFTQWAAAKYHNPALKTIVPYVAAIPGLGLPMENNVFINANYGWAFYTTNNKYLDNKTYYNPQRWRSLNFNWFNSGAAYNKIDSVDGTPNPWLQRWLKHPDYGSFWQQQVPYQHDFANINIPVLTFEGYYDDGQISGLHYYQEHLKYNARANHYLIIGPYDHFGTQSGGIPVLREYKVDPVSLISTRDITFEWLDYVLKGAKKPRILADKVNYEVMGANEWKHTSTVEKMADERLKLYLTNVKAGENFQLSTSKPIAKASLNQTIDLAGRKDFYGDYYPYPIVKDSLDRSNGLFFISKPFDKPVEVNGIFTGELKAVINKKDMDITVTLYEVTPQGKYFELSYFIGRASYAKGMEKRVLLEPGKEQSIPFTRTRMVSRQLSKGSRLLVVLNTDKNPFAEINYGTGKDVAAETAADGNIPLKIDWMNDSYIEVPLKW